MFSKTNEFAVQSGVALVGLVVEESFNKNFGWVKFTMTKKYFKGII